MSTKSFAHRLCGLLPGTENGKGGGLLILHNHPHSGPLRVGGGKAK